MTNNHELLGIHHVTAMTDDAIINFYRSIRHAFS